jgi:hypothetical protein
MSPARVVLVAALAIACHGALAQTVVPPAVTVQRTAPQLVNFAGSTANFQNLVNGLAQGTQVQLVTVLPDGFTQIVTFTPTAALPPVQIAQVLETARQQLIGIGIANPTAEQIAVTLMGGVVPTPLGGSQVTGVLPQNVQNPPSPAAQIQGNAAAGATTSTTPTPTTPSTVIPPVNVQIFPAATTGTATATTGVQPRANTSDSLNAPGSTSRTPLPSPPTTPGAASTTTPPASVAGAPAAAPTTTTPAPTAAQPGNANSGTSALRR